MLGWALALTSAYLVAEVVGGFVFNSLALLCTAVSSVPGVEGLHDLHVWSMSNDDVSCTMHVTLMPGADPDFVRKAVTGLINNRFGIEHTTIQTEGSGIACEESDHLHD